MCGIVGAAARRNIVPVLVEGLRRLEYRGYDSCGIALPRKGALELERTVSRVADLAARLRTSRAHTGVAHTRWATHGRPATRNAHPIVSQREIAVVHNGIIENHDELRAELTARGYRFESETDTEVVAHLVHSLYDGDLVAAVRRAATRLKGAYAIAVVSTREPDTVVGARQGSPLVIGTGSQGTFIASDAIALAGSAERIAYVQDGEVVAMTSAGCTVVDRNGGVVTPRFEALRASETSAELGPYRHFMQKEIFEQPRALTNTLADVTAISPELFGPTAHRDLQAIDSVLILGCGTSYHAGLIGKQWIERLAGVRCDVEIASEYRYRESVPNARGLVLAISQSGETADTLSAIRHAMGLGHAGLLTLCNVATSAMSRESSLRFLTRAGPEIGVASTKAFTTQLAALFVFALTLAKMRGRLSGEAESQHLAALRQMPAALSAILALEPQIVAWAQRFADKQHALFLGRGIHYPVALEGALKLKEISYIHAEAYPAGELKHGPLALVTADMPVVTIAPDDALLEKLKSNMQEVRARGGELYVLADRGCNLGAEDGGHVIPLPGSYGLLSPLYHVVPLQLLAYHTALIRGTDVDKPRNLAKSVTVE